jgi:hypothetical protein
MAKPKRDNASEATQESAAIIAAFSAVRGARAKANDLMVLILDSPARIRVVLKRRRF